MKKLPAEALQTWDDLFAISEPVTSERRQQAMSSEIESCVQFTFTIQKGEE